MSLCITCNKSFKSPKCLQAHLKSKRHQNAVNKVSLLCFECGVCGKMYSCRQSLHVHKKSCFEKTEISMIEKIEQLQNAAIENRKLFELDRIQHEKEREEFQKEREEYQKERDEMRAQIALIFDRDTTTNNTTIETQNITININAFGNENIDYLEDKTIHECIDRVYKSIPSLLEKIHFDPSHPENHNIKITNKKLPYACVMGNNHKWKTVDRKDAIETMVNNGYNLLDFKYNENKNRFPLKKQQNFESFQDKFENEDKPLLKQLKSDVEMMVMNA